MELKSLPTNGGGHLYKSSKYAHFSQVAIANKACFPLFEKATPVSFRVEKGECLTIPKGWWHHVKSFGSRCLSVNFWYDNGDKPGLSETPIKISNAISNWKALERWSNEYLSEKIDTALPDGVWLILDNFACKKSISIKDFVSIYGNGKSYAYLITPSDFEHILDATPNNKHILDILAEDFEVPFPEKMLNADANFWMNFGGLDTGLHFDDEDGLLCVVEGYKEILLYPPSDSQYLYPYPSNPIVLQHSYERFLYNLYKRGPKLETTISMATLLEVCLHKSPNVAIIAEKLQQHYGPGKIVYGVKTCDGVVRYEFYFYGISPDFDKEVEAVNFYSDADHNSQWELSKYMGFHKELFPNDVYDISQVDKTKMCIFSIDLTEAGVILGQTPNLNLYYTPDAKINMPFILYEKTYNKNGSQHVRSVVWTEEYKTMFSNVNTFVSKCKMIGLTLEDAENIIKFALKTEYVCDVVSVFNKGPQVGLYFFGVHFQPFLEFLDFYNYPAQVVELCLKHREDVMQMNLEVGFHFDKGSQTATPLRTAFYGVF